MNKAERERYKKILMEKKEEIGAKLSEAYSESREVETGIAQDIADKAESSYTKEFLLSLSDAERKQLFLIDEALKRIEKDEYGICQMCQKNISKKRLNAVPWAPHCIECQEKAEEES
ncbi:MAG: TraR/DksA family transcriptional regulator [Candidatus Aminicenantes bacterium]|nr:TraR/DksA family transcriptional regulator [Candidatus Aminicenantes bacterium]